MKNGWTENAFWDVNNKKCRKWCKFGSPILLIKLMAYLCSQRTLNVQIKYFMLVCSINILFVLNRGWKRDSTQIMLFVYICLKCNLVELKNRFQTWITRNDMNDVSLFHLSLIITHWAYVGSQWTPNVQIKIFKYLNGRPTDTVC
jgi:hypothetical protein